MTLYAWLLALFASLGLDPGTLPGDEGSAPSLFMPPPPAEPPATGDAAQTRPTRPSRPGVHGNDIYNGF